MLEFIEKLFDQIDPLVAYLVLFLSAILENIIPPVPGDTVVIVGAYLVSIGQLNFWGVYISTFLLNPIKDLLNVDLVQFLYSI